MAEFLRRHLAEVRVLQDEANGAASHVRAAQPGMTWRSSKQNSRLMSGIAYRHI